MRFSTLKRTAAVFAVTVTLAFAGLIGQAHALLFSPGDAVLVIYGNDNQGYLNLGNWNTLKASGGSFDVSSILNTAGVSGANTIQYTIVGNGPPGPLPMFFGNDVDISSWTTAQKNAVFPNTYNTPLVNWRGQLTTANDASRQIYAAADPFLSFDQYLNTLHDNTLAGSIPSPRRGSTDIDQILHLLERTGAAATLAEVNTAFLNSTTKFFTIGGAAPVVPVPAAAVLFATGMIGLVGLARRSMGLSRV